MWSYYIKATSFFLVSSSTFQLSVCQPVFCLFVCLCILHRFLSLSMFYRQALFCTFLLSNLLKLESREFSRICKKEAIKKNAYTFGKIVGGSVFFVVDSFFSLLVNFLILRGRDSLDLKMNKHFTKYITIHINIILMISSRKLCNASKKNIHFCVNNITQYEKT